MIPENFDIFVAIQALGPFQILHIVGEFYAERVIFPNRNPAIVLDENEAVFHLCGLSLGQVPPDPKWEELLQEMLAYVRVNPHLLNQWDQ